MENINENQENNKDMIKPQSAGTKRQDEGDAEFENPSVDPGLETGGNTTADLDDECKENIDPPMENDAMNYKNDREHGAYNPKNI